MDPRDFLKVAGMLATVAGDPVGAKRRTAIGRAYFAAYNVAAEMLSVLGAPPMENAEGHNQAVRLLEVSGDEDLRTLGILLSSLRTERNRADYNMSRTDVESGNKARTATETAQEIIRDLDAFLASPTRQGRVRPLIQDFYQTTYKPK
jgi:hypothetical protein